MRAKEILVFSMITELERKVTFFQFSNKKKGYKLFSINTRKYSMLNSSLEGGILFFCKKNKIPPSGELIFKPSSIGYYIYQRKPYNHRSLTY